MKLDKFLKEKLKEILTEEMLVLLTGSRSLGLEKKDSDYDCYLIINEIDRKRVQDKFFKEGWAGKDQNLSTNLEGDDKNQVTLIVKKYSELEALKTEAEEFIFSNSKLVIGKTSKLEEVKSKIVEKIDFEERLKKSYLSLMMNLRILTDLYDRKIMIPVSIIKKGDIVRDFIRTIILIDKKLPAYEKWLYWSFSNSKNFSKAKKFIEKINSVNSSEEAKTLRQETIDYLNKVMPEKEYVGKNWWRFL